MATIELDLPPEMSADEARLLLTIKLFERRRISLGRAAELAGYSKRAFMEVLGNCGVNVVDYPADEAARECHL